MKKIKFWSTTGNYGEFSNFAKFPIKIDGKVYPTSEHYFQSQKFIGTDDDYAERIRNAKTAKIAASMGRDRSRDLRKDWDSVNYDVMFKVCFEKFST